MVKRVPHIICQKDNVIVTRDQPDRAFTDAMGTKFSPPKRLAYTTKLDTYQGMYTKVRFASSIQVGSKLVTDAWVKDSDWSWEA